jgi:hypothetical protein
VQYVPYLPLTHAFDCGVAGDPCPICNHADADNHPDMPPGFVPEMIEDEDGED